MRHLKTYRVFESQGVTLDSKQTEWLDWVCSSGWQMGEDGRVNVLGDVDLAKGQGRGQGSTHLRYVDLGDGYTRQINSRGVRFGMVSGTFNCSRMMLEDLDGCPHTVGVDFLAWDNHIVNLKGGPRKVRKNYDVNDCRIESLEGCPDEVGGTFILDNNILHNLEGITPTFTGWLHIDGNKLVSLEGLKKCKGITCYDNTVSTETLYLIFDFIQEYPEMGYGAILASLQSRISQEDWEKLDKSSLDKMNQTRKKVYGMLGGIGGI